MIYLWVSDGFRHFTIPWMPKWVAFLIFLAFLIGGFMVFHGTRKDDF